MRVKTLRTQIIIWKIQAEADLIRIRVCLFFAILRYHLLCFKHFGWRRLVIFFLKTPEHLKAIFLALFTHAGDIGNR